MALKSSTSYSFKLVAIFLSVACLPHGGAELRPQGRREEVFLSAGATKTEPDSTETLSSEKSHGLLVWGHLNGTDTWQMVELHERRPGSARVLFSAKRLSAPVDCSFALTSQDKAVFFNGLQLVSYNLTTGKQLGAKEIKDPSFETFDYNPNSGRFEGVCQMWRPEQNSSETCWCSLNDTELQYAFQMPTEFYGEVRPGCVGRLDASRNSFWYPAGTFDSEKWLVAVGADSHQDPVDAEWFGVVNGTTMSGDAYVHDYKQNRSFAVQVDAHSTTQLVEVLRGEEPWMKNNSYPKFLTNFPPGFRLAADGLMDYNETRGHMFLLMHVSPVYDDGANAFTHYLVTVDMNKPTDLKFEPIYWPHTTFQPASMKLW